MNSKWSRLNKTMQAQIKERDTYRDRDWYLIQFRSQLMQTFAVSSKKELRRENFNSIPFINVINLS